MIKGIGVDLVHIDRLERWVNDPGLVSRFFHPLEIEDCRRPEGLWAPSLAARFAAKEALGKALGSGLAGLKLSEIQVSKNRQGKPSIQVHGSTAQVIQDLGISEIFLSLSHDKDIATAFVVLEGHNV